MEFRRCILANRADGIETSKTCTIPCWLGLPVGDFPYTELLFRRYAIEVLEIAFEVLGCVWLGGRFGAQA